MKHWRTLLAALGLLLIPVSICFLLIFRFYVSTGSFSSLRVNSFGSPQWSADSRLLRFEFTENMSGQDQSYVIDIEARDVHRPTSRELRQFAADTVSADEVSPDGRYTVRTECPHTGTVVMSLEDCGDSSLKIIRTSDNSVVFTVTPSDLRYINRQVSPIQNLVFALVLIGLIMVVPLLVQQIRLRQQDQAQAVAVN